MNFADALCRLEPGAEITALGTGRGLDTTLIPARGYRLGLIPPVPAATQAEPGPAADAGQAAQLGTGGRGGARLRAGRDRGGLRRLHGHARLSRRPPAGPRPTTSGSTGLRCATPPGSGSACDPTGRY